MWFSRSAELATWRAHSVAGAWAGWFFFEASEPVAQLRWGLPAAVLLLMSLIIKLAVAPAIHTTG
jgi:hypothetical protein